ncbi:MAG: AbrB/MazE/SpoVT family DNA-binding domain-containing protein, partial [Gammaproteobacteria bacterium]
METTTVTTKGQVTIPLEVRKQLGIRKGARMEFRVVGDHVEMRLSHQPEAVPESGFGLLKSSR